MHAQNKEPHLSFIEIILNQGSTHSLISVYNRKKSYPCYG